MNTEVSLDSLHSSEEHIPFWCCCFCCCCFTKVAFHNVQVLLLPTVWLVDRGPSALSGAFALWNVTRISRLSAVARWTSPAHAHSFSIGPSVFPLASSRGGTSAAMAPPSEGATDAFWSLQSNTVPSVVSWRLFYLLPLVWTFGQQANEVNSVININPSIKPSRKSRKSLNVFDHRFFCIMLLSLWIISETFHFDYIHWTFDEIIIRIDICMYCTHREMWPVAVSSLWL